MNDFLINNYYIKFIVILLNKTKINYHLNVKIKKLF